jgi:hypothetical protein
VDSWFISSVGVLLLYFTRWFKLNSAAGLEKARIITPSTRHNTAAANMIGIVRELPTFGT